MHSEHPASLEGCHIAFFSWRDTKNPEGGGAERYLEKIASGLAQRGCRVTILCAAHPGAPEDETVDGVRFVRRGTKMSVYAQGVRALFRHELGDVDLVVDVQNGMPFFTRTVTRKPVVVLVHHVHREQWPVVYPGATGRVGWVDREPGCAEALPPEPIRRGLAGHPHRAHRSRGESATHRVVHNGTDKHEPTHTPRTPHPSICVVGRLVPHKQVEHAIDAVGVLRGEFPTLQLVVVGGGWWEAELRDHARKRGLTDAVVFEGHVSEERKYEVYSQSWLLALPSLKEGWGLVVGEAGMMGTPAVAYRSAGGTRESIIDGRSGVLVDDREEFTRVLGELLRDDVRRKQLGDGATEVSHMFTWEHAQQSFAAVLRTVLDGGYVAALDPE